MKKSKIFWGYAVLALVIYAVVQLLISNGVIQFYYQNMFIAMCINVILAVSLHVIIGVTGQFSIGHAGFLAVGAYISAICTMKFGMVLPGGCITDKQSCRYWTWIEYYKNACR